MSGTTYKFHQQSLKAEVSSHSCLIAKEIIQAEELKVCSLVYICMSKLYPINNLQKEMNHKLELLEETLCKKADKSDLVELTNMISL